MSEDSSRYGRPEHALAGTFRGADAEQRYLALPTPRHELAVVCRAPNEEVRHRFGLADDLAFRYCTHDDGAKHLETRLRKRKGAEALFGDFLEGLRGRRGGVNSDPHSRDFFETEPKIEELAALIAKELDVALG